MDRLDPHDHKTGRQDPADIAAQLERDREALARSIGQLRGQLSPNVVLQRVVAQARDGTVPYALKVVDKVGVRPLATAAIGIGVVGAGLAWLMSGRKSSPARIALDTDSAWVLEVDALRDAAVRDLDRIAADHSSPAEIAAKRGEVMSRLANATRAAQLRGWEGLDRHAQDKMVVSRERAYSARIAAARQSRRTTDIGSTIASGISSVVNTGISAGMGTVLKVALGPNLADKAIALARPGPDRDRVAADAGRALASFLAAEVGRALSNSAARKTLSQATRSREPFTP